MRKVKSRDTGSELILRRLVWRLGYRYRLYAKDLPGKPDLVFRGRWKVIFVHGCFWHGHHCPRGSRTPSTRVEYWQAKLARNRVRDRENIQSLQAAGWDCMVVWECQLKDEKHLTDIIHAFLGQTTGQGITPPPSPSAP